MAAKKHSALTFVLKGLVPYSQENLLLSFKPNRFFDELEKQSGYRRKTLEEAARRGRQRGLIARHGSALKLTALGSRTARPYAAERLPNGKLMVIFDIPNSQSASRRTFRNLLRLWGFGLIQKSVWMSELDHRQSVKEAVEELDLQDCVEVYECIQLEL